MPARVLSLLMILYSLLPILSSQSTDNTIYLPLVVLQLPSPSEQEPNNSRAQATGPLQSGVAYNGVHGSEQDMYDIFFFEATRTGQVRITLDNHPIGNVQLQLHSASSVLPIRYDYLAPYQIDYNLVTTGKYYIAIYAPPSPVSRQIYQLTVTYP